MKKPYYILFLYLFLGISMPQVLYAQTAKTSKELVDEGIKLHDEGKYDEAIAKYQEALKADPQNLLATYELAYSLYSSGKKKDAIPHLEKIINTPNVSKYESYEMLGNIYDDEKQSDKAVEMYKKGIVEKPDYARLRYNLGVAYLGQKKYDEAEASAIEGVKLDPNHPASQWLFATVNNNKSNKLKAVMGFSNYLLLEPSTQRSASAFETLRKLLTNSVTKTGEKAITISVSDDMLNPDKAGDLMISTVATTVVGKGLSPVEELTELLTSVYQIAGELAEKKSGDFLFVVLCRLLF